jgi:hypothetical protein
MTIYNTQPSYPTGIGLVPWAVGQVANMEKHDIVSRTCETAAGIAFGLACSHGTKDGTAVIGGTKFEGISVRDVDLDPILAANYAVDIYPQNTTMGLLTFGAIAVTAVAACAPGDAVWYNNTTGQLTNVTGAGWTQIAGAQWQTTTGAGAVGVIKLGTMT